LRVLLPVAVVTLFVGAGCQEQEKQEAKDIAATGSTLSADLATFFADLAQGEVEYQLLHPNPGAPKDAAHLSEDDQPLMARRYGNLADVARAWNALYDALGKLAGYDATKEIGGAAKGLHAALTGTKAWLPSVSGLGQKETGQIVDDAMAQIAGAMATSEYRKQLRYMDLATRDWVDLFDALRPLFWSSVNGEATAGHEFAARRKINGTAMALTRTMTRYGLVLIEPPQAGSQLDVAAAIRVEMVYRESEQQGLKRICDLSSRLYAQELRQERLAGVQARYPRFRPTWDDIPDPRSFVLSLRRHQCASPKNARNMPEFVAASVSQGFRALVRAFEGNAGGNDELRGRVADELNALLTSKDLYNPTWFPTLGNDERYFIDLWDIADGDDPLKLLSGAHDQARLSGRCLAGFNRRLLEEAFSSALRQSNPKVEFTENEGG
jgi:hypothetical protein